MKVHQILNPRPLSPAENLPRSKLTLSLVDAEDLPKSKVSIKVEYPEPKTRSCSKPIYELIYQRVDRLGYEAVRVTPNPTSSVTFLDDFPRWIEVVVNGTIKCDYTFEYYSGKIFTGEGGEWAEDSYSEQS